MKTSRLISIVVFTIFGVGIFAQDLHFSQYTQTPIIVNPAMTGTMDGTVRVMSNYRIDDSALGIQGREMALSLDARLKLGKQDYLGLGFAGVRDKVGELDFGSDQYKFALSYIRKMGNFSSATHHIVVGTDLGFVKRKVDVTDARWPSQHNGNGGFDPDAPQPEGFDPEFNYRDLSVGMLWMSQFTSGYALQLGMAVHHVNNPDISFFAQGNEGLTMRHTFHGDGTIPLSERYSISPDFLILKQGNFRELNLGTRMTLAKLAGPVIDNIQLGAYYRTLNMVDEVESADAIVLMLALQIRHFRLGVSRDNFLGTTLPWGAPKVVEFSLGYVMGGSGDNSLHTSSLP